MVHVRKCPLIGKKSPYKRGKPTTEFHRRGKPRIYCYGWIDVMTEDPFQECMNCKDWAWGEQVEKDCHDAWVEDRIEQLTITLQKILVMRRNKNGGKR